MTEVLAPPQHQEPDSASPGRRTVDQTLSAATHVAEGFADYVAGIIDGRPGACGPSLTEDPVALLRHATAARRLRGYRDLACGVIALAVFVMVVARLAVRWGGGVSVAIVAVVILTILGYRRLWRAVRLVFAWAWKTRRDRRRPGPLRWILGFFVAGLLAVVLVVRQPMLWHCVGIVLAGLAAGWLTVVTEAVVAHRRAAAIVARNAPPPRHLAAPLAQPLEQRVAELADANVIAYSEARASAPFVGNGFVVRPKTLDIDVHRRAGDDNGANAFTLLDIVAFHERLEAQFAIENAVESTAARKITAGHRLYVDGRKIPWSSDLIEPGRPVPRSRVSWDYLVEELTHPERADDRRVYFYLQEIGRDGEIGVCIFVRPLLQGGKLSLEFQPLVIPPIHPDVEALIADLPRTLRDQVGRAARIWTLRVPAAVFGGPLRCAVRAARWISRSAVRVKWRLSARWNWFYDLGAVMSVREGVCWRVPDEYDHFVIRDLIRINDQLGDRLTTSIKAYLRELGVDTEQLDTAITVNNIQNWSVGNVRADMVGFGNNNTFGSPGRDADGGKG